MRKLIPVILVWAARAAQADVDVLYALDEPQLMVSLGETGDEANKKYQVRVRGVVTGKLGESDRIQVDWKQKGKVLATMECRVQADQGRPSAAFECRQEDGGLTAHGD